MTITTFTRAFPLEDISIRSGGDGRTVEAYAAVFDRGVPIRDHQGEYQEVITRGAFRKTLAERGTNFQVFYNHARGIHGQPSDMFSIPIGTPVEVKEDARGLVTVTRYNNTDLADQVLESIRNGDIKGQSFSGAFVKSDPEPPKFGFRRAEDGGLTTVRRTEIAMREYGPTPFPAYDEAAILGVRMALLSELLSPDDLRRLADTHPSGAGMPDTHSSDGEPGSHDEPTSDGHSARGWTPERLARRQALIQKGSDSQRHRQVRPVRQPRAHPRRVRGRQGHGGSCP